MKRILTAAILLCASVAQGAIQDAVGTIGGGCSCVVISPDGYVLTAEHCQPGETATVTLGDMWYKAKRVNAVVRNGVDEAVLYKITTATLLTFAPVSLDVPEAGDKVSSMGYPNGKWAESSGEILSVSGEFGKKSNDPRSLDTSYVIHVNFGAAGGNSGGPLFNEAGEVVGLTSTTSPDGSRCIGWGSISKATDGITFVQRFRREKTHVLAFGYPGCPPCDRHKRDEAAGMFPDIEFEYVNVKTPEGWERFVKLGAAIERATAGSPRPFKFRQRVPAFHRKGEAVIVYDYGAGDDKRLLGWLMETIRIPLTLTESLFGLIYPNADGGVDVPGPENSTPFEEPSVDVTPPAAAPTPKEPVPPKDLPDDDPVDAPEPEDDSFILVLLAAGMGLVETFLRKKVKA